MEHLTSSDSYYKKQILNFQMESTDIRSLQLLYWQLPWVEVSEYIWD